MFMGVPYVPFFLATGGCLLLAMYFNLFFLLLIPPAMLLMRHMARRDELIFRLLGLRWRFRLRTRNVRGNDGLWVYSPSAYRDRPGAGP